MAFTDYLGEMAGTAIGALGLWHAARTKTRFEARNEQRDDERADVEVVDARWQSMLEQHRAHFDLMLAPMSSRIDHLETKVRTLELAYATLAARHRIAVDHIRDAHRWAGGDRIAPFPAVPVELADEV